MRLLRAVAISKQAAITTSHGHYRYYAWVFSKEIDTMPSDYSLSDLLERLYETQEALEAAIMELTLLVEEQEAPEAGGNVRGSSRDDERERRPYQTRLGSSENGTLVNPCLTSRCWRRRRIDLVAEMLLTRSDSSQTIACSRLVPI
jgi:hypothetical protein